MAKISFDSTSVPDQPENVIDFPLSRMSWQVQGFEDRDDYENWLKWCQERMREEKEMPKVRGHVWIVKVSPALGGRRVYVDKETARQSIRESFSADATFEFAEMSTDIHCTVKYPDGRTEKVTAACFPVWSSPCPVR